MHSKRETTAIGRWRYYQIPHRLVWSWIEGPDRSWVLSPSTPLLASLNTHLVRCTTRFADLLRPLSLLLFAYRVTVIIIIIIIIIILFESGNMAHTQTHKDIQTDRISKKCTIKHTKSHKNADRLTHRSSFTRSLLCLGLLQTYRKDFLHYESPRQTSINPMLATSLLHYDICYIRKISSYICYSSI